MQSSWFYVLSVTIKFLSFQECFFPTVTFCNPEIKSGEKSLGLDTEFPFSLVKGVKVIWR